MSRRTFAATVAAIMSLGACTTSGSNKSGLGSATTTTVASTSASSWGTLSDLCKPGNARVDATQNHGSGKLNLGTATDKSSTVVPGLLQEMWDASRSFVKWCNDNGGIQGLKINLVDLDAALFNAKA